MTLRAPPECQNKMLQKSAEKLQSIKAQIHEEAAAARQTLRNETEALAKDIAGKVLGRAV